MWPNIWFKKCAKMLQRTGDINFWKSGGLAKKGGAKFYLSTVATCQNETFLALNWRKKLCLRRVNRGWLNLQVGRTCSGAVKIFNFAIQWNPPALRVTTHLSGSKVKDLKENPGGFFLFFNDNLLITCKRLTKI